MKIFIRRILLFMLPLLPVVATYMYFDPFKVLRSYDVYYVEGDGGYLNKNYVSTMNYINKRDKYHYDSFIFGNSRSMFYMTMTVNVIISLNQVAQLTGFTINCG